MEERNNGRVSIGFSLPTVLTIVFLILKLCGVINWSWLWVFSPLWISISVTLVLVLVIIIIKLIARRRK